VRAAAAQRLDALERLERVPDVRAERLIHVRDQRRHALAEAASDLDHALRERLAVRERLQERAVAGLDVEHQRVGALGHLLAHDRAGDQRQALDRAGHVAQRVELAVGRRDLGRLPDHAEPALLDHAPELGERQVHAKTGDRLQLVERAAGVAEPAPGDHRHVDAARGRERREDQAGLVAHASRRVLVGLGPVEVVPAQHLAGAHHRLGQRLDLGVAHALEEDRHRERRRLVVGDLAARVAGDEELDLGALERQPVALLQDQVGGAHRRGYFFFRRSTSAQRSLRLRCVGARGGGACGGAGGGAMLASTWSISFCVSFFFTARFGGTCACL
jgi:hypothetical protein